jgi:hypothetical protein
MTSAGRFSPLGPVGIFYGTFNLMLLTPRPFSLTMRKSPSWGSPAPRNPILSLLNRHVVVDSQKLCIVSDGLLSGSVVAHYCGYVAL